MTRRLWTAAALAAFLSMSGTLAARAPGGGGAYDPGRDPARDLSAATAEARRDQKRVLIEVGGNWCGWCRELERFVRGDPGLSDALRCAFVVVRVNVSPENENTKFLSDYPQVPGYPFFFVLDEAGSLLASVDTDEFLTGEAYDRGKLLAFARKWTRPEPGAKERGD